jgi:outer membrane protein OmpA-like peptidoglycan-associated protein
MQTAKKTCVLAFVLALAGLATATARADDLSTSVMRPTPVDPATGLVAGNLPGGQGSKSYYVTVDLQAGDLVTQLQVAGTPDTGKKIEFELLNESARMIASVYAMAGLDAKGEATKTFPIDRAGRYVVRLNADGKESGTYCVLMGGSALPTARAPGCPAPAAAPAPVVAAPPPPPPPPQRVETPAPPPAVSPPTTSVEVLKPNPRPVEVLTGAKQVEVITTRCEDRLRVGSDFLFDFDRAELRSEAEPALAELARRVAQANKMVMIEGHTDAKGTDSYNQTLSERRATAVRLALVAHGLGFEKLNIRGFGKTRPVAPNQYADGTDDPEGRQRNRRVEVVINTCS